MNTVLSKSKDCRHQYVRKMDWEGDPEVPGGTHCFFYWECIYCGLGSDQEPPEEQQYEVLQDYHLND